MRIANRDRLWLLGGLIVALILVLVAWQFMIKGQHDQTDSVRNSIATADQQVTTTTNRLNALRADSVNLDKYKAALAADQQALPSDTALPAFVRELQAAAVATSMGIVQLQVGQPAAVVSGSTSTATSAGGPQVYSVTINVVATGAVDNATAFINQLQAVQPRAILMTTVSESPGSTGGNAVQLSLTFNAFVAPTDGKVPAAS
jgi:Tfp pilus assembly protein PilO